MKDQANREGIVVGVEETAAAHAAGAADEFVGEALVADQPEALVDHLAGHVDQRLDPHRHLLGIELGPAQPGLLGGERQDTVGGDHHRGIQLSAAPQDRDPGNAAVLVDQVIHRGAGDQGGAGLDGLFGQPAVETGAEDGIAVVGGAVEIDGFVLDVEAGLTAS